MRALALAVVALLAAAGGARAQLSSPLASDKKVQFAWRVVARTCPWVCV